jgi:hypothetical protein
MCSVSSGNIFFYKEGLKDPLKQTKAKGTHGQ